MIIQRVHKITKYINTQKTEYNTKIAENGKQTLQNMQKTKNTKIQQIINTYTNTHIITYSTYCTE